MLYALQESVTEVHKEEVSSIPKLLELNLEESHRTWGDEVEDAMKRQEDDARNKTFGAKDTDRRPDMGLADVRRYDSGRNRGEIGRSDDRPPAKKMKDGELVSYRSQRDGGYNRDKTRGGRGRGKSDMSRGGAVRGGRGSANDYRYTQGRDNVVSEYQPSRGEKRGTLTFERSDLHPERQSSFENKRGQYRSTEAGSRHGRDGRGRDGRENYMKKDDRKLPDAQSSSETVVSGSDREPTRTNAWNLPLSGPKQTSDLSQLDEIPDIGEWNASNQPLKDGEDGGTDKEPLRKNAASDLSHDQDKPEIGSQSVESRGNDRESGRLSGFRAESYRGDRGSRQSRRGRRQNWSEQVDGGEGMQRYPRRSQQRLNRDGRGGTSDGVNDEPDEATSHEDRYQSDRRRSSRFGSGGRGLRQSGHGEYPMRSRGRGMFCIICQYFSEFLHVQSFYGHSSGLPAYFILLKISGVP